MIDRDPAATGHAARVTDLTNRQAWRVMVTPFMVAKLISLLVPVIWVVSNSASLGHASSDELRTAFNQWDSQSYVHIAEQGYPSQTDDRSIYIDAFLPGYPLLIRLFEIPQVVLAILGVAPAPDAVVYGLLVSAIGEAVALYYIVRMVAAERDAGDARFVCWALALSPLAFFLTAVYTESVFIALAAAALYHARRGDPVLACVLAALSCGVRITGLALIPALLIEALRRNRWRPHRQLAALALIPVPFLAFCLYLGAHTGDVRAFFHAQTSSSFSYHHLDLPWNGLGATLTSINSASTASNNFVFQREVFAGVVGLGVVIWAWSSRRFPRSWAAWCTVVWLSAVSISFWLSVPRYELAMFPALVLVADVTRRHPSWRSALVTFSAGLMSLGAVMYAHQQWLG